MRFATNVARRHKMTRHSELTLPAMDCAQLPPTTHTQGLTGTLPSEWSYWSYSLTGLTLDNMAYVAGEIPDDWQYLGELQQVNISRMPQLDGYLPEGWLSGALDQIERLNICECEEQTAL